MNTEPISLVRIDPVIDREELIAFLTGHEWPYHMAPIVSRQQVEEALDSGAFQNEERDSYWIEHSEHGRIGYIRFEDLCDDTPVFDLRLASQWQGRGFGVDVLNAATSWIFEQKPRMHRFEGQTRDDNLAMRHTFLKARWVKEAYYRQGWPVEGAEPRASVAYAILRSDWETNTTTPVPWEEL